MTTPRPGPPARLGALALLVGVVGLGCGGTGDPTWPGSRPPSNEGGGIIVAFGEDTGHYPADDWTLESGEVEGDELALEVRYSGGCAEHDFWLLAVGEWIPLPDAGITERAGVRLLLPHDDRDDPCDAVVGRTIRFDLGPLGEAFRRDFGAVPGRILLQIPDRRDGTALRVFDWPVPAGSS